IAGDVENIFVLGASRQDLLANDEERGSDGILIRFWHLRPWQSDFRSGDHYRLPGLSSRPMRETGKRAGRRCRTPDFALSDPKFTYNCSPMSNLEFARAQARDTKIKLHGPEAFAGMAKAGRLAAEVLDLLVEEVKPGTTTEALDDFVFTFAMDHGAVPAPLNYRGFPKSICTSLNHV